MRWSTAAASVRQRGSVLVEFALCAPLLLLLLAGVLDFSMLLRTAASVADAARAGAAWGSLSMANAGNTSGIQAAVTNAAPGIAGMTSSASQACQCSGASASCGSSCPSGMSIYVVVTAQATAPTIFRYSGLPFSGHVAFTASMRAQ